MCAIYKICVDKPTLIKAVLVDMEEGVISEMMRGPLGSLFDHNQLISSVSGSGNNWSVWHPLSCLYYVSFRFYVYLCLYSKGDRSLWVRS